MGVAVLLVSGACMTLSWTSALIPLLVRLGLGISILVIYAWSKRRFDGQVPGAAGPGVGGF